MNRTDVIDKDSFLFEVSWEVCNKVGGIYTVLTSKMKEVIKTFGENYICIGPVREINPEFVEEHPSEFEAVIERLKSKNIFIRVGRWRISENPKCILVDFYKAFSQTDKLLFHLWERFGVDSMLGGYDYVEPVLFSTAAGMVIEEVVKEIKKGKIFAHFHEWLSGAGLLYVKEHLPHIFTVFTTHATILGRAMSSAGVDVSSDTLVINPVDDSKKYGVSAKHSMESVCAREADCFTAVSNIVARECLNFLGKKPHVVTPNGFDLPEFKSTKDFIKDHKKTRRELLDFAGSFLGEEFNEKSTLLISTSGRYEFHNKGFDVVLDALSNINQIIVSKNVGKKIVCFFFVMGGKIGVQSAVQKAVSSKSADVHISNRIATHYVGPMEEDPIVKSCMKLKLLNQPEDYCKVILVPVPLDGNDGVFNKHYYDVIVGCDLNIYCSDYEPWGYTPVESLAVGVPAVTVDKSGFGNWIMENVSKKDIVGLWIINRKGVEYAQIVQQLVDIILSFDITKEKEIMKLKQGARKLGSITSWKDFYRYYLKAYEQAVVNRQFAEGAPYGEGAFELQASNTQQIHMRKFAVVPPLPEKFSRLNEIANNIWWTWQPGAIELFSRIDPVLWEESGHNPVKMLHTLPISRLKELEDNPKFFDLYEDILERYDNYMLKKDADEFSPYVTSSNPVVFFSMEIGLHESIPCYSGGLGILAGDYLKSASDLNIPVIGISLMYKYGYFTQIIKLGGEQIDKYVETNFGEIPVEIVRNGSGEDRLLVPVELPGRIVYVQIWRIKVGKANLYLLDTDIGENARTDREITDRLYDVGSRERIEQEIVLGIGGVKFLEIVGIEPSVIHLNEGHCGFAIIGQLIHLITKKNINYMAALELAKACTVFTTHTPVEAGHEVFDIVLLENYLKDKIEKCGITWEQFKWIGVVDNDDKHFNMTAFCLRMSNKRNGVSRLHGKVARKMWHKIYSGSSVEQVPIIHITNGVHVASWMSPRIKELFETYADVDVDELVESFTASYVEAIPSKTLWQVHFQLKDEMYQQITDLVKKQWYREGISISTVNQFMRQLNPESLTIGFARRFAEYKRPLLIFHDIERLKKIIFDQRKPVTLIFAGKAHPADKRGCEMVKFVNKIAQDPEFAGKIIFLENYDIKLARMLVAGVDVWLNNPRRPLEASGTSGMKAALNGVINLSTLDGWWDECYDGENGWAFGKNPENMDTHILDSADADALYSLLEEEVVPLYFRGTAGDGVWVEKMKKSMISVLKFFSTYRMINDYYTMLYQPTARRYRELQEDNYIKAKQLAEWRNTVRRRFSSVHIIDVKMIGIRGDKIELGKEITIRVRINKGEMGVGELRAEFVLMNLISEQFEVHSLELIDHKNEILTFKLNYTPISSGTYKYGIRVVPDYSLLENVEELGCVRWA